MKSSFSIDSQPEHDRSLFISMACALLGIGVLMVHSASITGRLSSNRFIYRST